MNHYELAKLCKESYQHSTFSVKECEVLLRYSKGATYVVCRGTEHLDLCDKKGLWAGVKNMWDIARDLSVIPSHDKDLGWVHSGFLEGGLAVAEFIGKHTDKQQPLHFSGHSLGGALSLVCAQKLKAKGYNVKEWVGFASPKTSFMGKRKYSFQQTNYRYRNDIVPLMPRIIGYRHNYSVVRLLSDEVNKGPATWLDHDIDYYIMALRKDAASLQY